MSICPTCHQPVRVVGHPQPVGLTLQQKKLLGFLKERIAADGVAPSYLEMMTAMGLLSKSGISRLVNALFERGHLTMLPRRPRSIQLVEAMP